MRLRAILFFILIGSLAVFFVYEQATSTDQPGETAVGSRAPDFRIKDKTGSEVQLSNYRGKLVFLNFFRTDCEPCRAEVQDLQTLNTMFKGRAFQMLIISGDSSWTEVDDFYRTEHLSLPTYLDSGWIVYRQYILRGTPESFLIDGRGSVINHYIGAAAWTHPQTVAYIDKLIRNEETKNQAHQKNLTSRTD